jgi:hypothetical protein
MPSLRFGMSTSPRKRGEVKESERYSAALGVGLAASARSGNARANPARVAAITPRSVINPVTSRAGVTSNP